MDLVSTDSLRYIYSYITDRKQKAKINSKFDKSNKVEYGVPQGSIFGAYVFDNFICDLLLIT